MARFQVPGLAQIRDTDPNMYRVLKSMEDALANHSDQGNLDPTRAEQAAPPPISSLIATERNGIHDLQIVDNSPAYRGTNYFAYYAQDSDFSNEHKIDLGASQNHRVNLGPGKYYWRADSAYPTSPASAPVYHGGGKAEAVGSGAHTGPPMSAGQGTPGFGPMYRNSSVPPIRR